MPSHTHTYIHGRQMLNDDETHQKHAGIHISKETYTCTTYINSNRSVYVFACNPPYFPLPSLAKQCLPFPVSAFPGIILTHKCISVLSVSSRGVLQISVCYTARRR
uniref:Uncharacterized protein n=1 Tax=Octopus bimaculoides TaxID=37653 RepID=A0A0L8G1V3_OCTBM